MTFDDMDWQGGDAGVQFDNGYGYAMWRAGRYGVGEAVNHMAHGTQMFLKGYRTAVWDLLGRSGAVSDPGAGGNPTWHPQGVRRA